MTAIRFYTDAGTRVGPLFARRTVRFGAVVRGAARETAQRAATAIKLLGEGDISRAGNFGARWTEGLRVNVTEGGGNIRIQVTHDIPYFSVFERGKQIQGRPYLWLPFEFATDAKGVWPSAYPSPLFFVERKSDGLLIAGSRDTGELKYFAKEQVTIPKKFHLEQITREIARDMPSIYKDALKEAKGE